MEKAKAYLAVAMEKDPQIVKLIEAKKVASMVLKKEDDYLKELHEQGIIDELTLEELREQATEDHQRVRKMPEVAVTFTAEDGDYSFKRMTLSKKTLAKKNKDAITAGTGEEE